MLGRIFFSSYQERWRDWPNEAQQQPVDTGDVLNPAAISWEIRRFVLYCKHFLFLRSVFFIFLERGYENEKKLEKKATICVQGGYNPKAGEPRVLPIYQSTTYKYDDPGRLADIFDLKKKDICILGLAILQ